MVPQIGAVYCYARLHEGDLLHTSTHLSLSLVSLDSKIVVNVKEVLVSYNPKPIQTKCMGSLELISMSSQLFYKHTSHRRLTRVVEILSYGTRNNCLGFTCW